MIGIVLRVLTASLIGSVGFIHVKPRLRVAGMRFFRNLGRIKTRKRLTSGSHNSIALLLGREKEVFDNIHESDIIVDIEELKDADGSSGQPLWLAIRGRVYNVEEGWKFYGPDGPYHGFVGKDATRAFCTGCTKPECLISSMSNLTESEMKEADRWVEYYELHDKYSLVGMLQNVTGTIDDLVEKALEAEREDHRSPPRLVVTESERSENSMIGMSSF